MTTASVIRSLQIGHKSSSGIGSESSSDDDWSSGTNGGRSFFPFVYASKSIAGIAYSPVLVNIAPLVPGSAFTMKL